MLKYQAPRFQKRVEAGRVGTSPCWEADKVEVGTQECGRVNPGEKTDAGLSGPHHFSSINKQAVWGDCHNCNLENKQGDPMEPAREETAIASKLHERHFY